MSILDVVLASFCLVTSWRHIFKVTTKKSPQQDLICSSFKYPLKEIYFDYALPTFDPKLTKSLLRGEGCIHTANKSFSSVEVVINHQVNDHKNIYTCSLFIKYIHTEESRSPYKPVGVLNNVISPPVTFWRYCKSNAPIRPISK